MKDSASPAFATRPPSARGVSIRLRLLALVLAAALPQLAFSIVQVRRADREAREKAEEIALQLARRIAMRVDDHVSVVDALLVTLSHVLRTDANGAAHNDSLLASLSEDIDRRFLVLSVSDSLGHVTGLSNASSTLKSYEVADRKYFRDAMGSRGLGFGDPMTGRVTGAASIGIGRAILDRNGRPQGVVAASTMLAHIERLLVPGSLPESAVVTLLDERGVVLARTEDGKAWVGRDISELSSTRITLAERQGVREVDGIDGVERLAAFATASKVPWHVFVGVRKSTALAAVHAQERDALILGLASLIVSLGIAWIIAQRIAKPVTALIADANAFASGDLAHRSLVEADGEPGQLADTFNRMAGALQRRSDELSESERRYRVLFKTMPLPMWVYSLDSLRFSAVNQAAVDRYGYTNEEFLSMSVMDVRPATDVPRLAQVISEIDGKAIKGQAWTHRTKSGELIDVEVTSDGMVVDGTPARLVVAIDVTERNRIERALHASQEQLRQSQKMEAVGSLAGGIAHDFNNLLTAILGYCDLALESAEVESPVREDLLEIRRAAQRAAELTHQLLAFSRRQMLKPTVFSLNTAVQGTVKILRRLISENIALELSLGPEALLVCADPGQVEQVILNLAVNARDAMARGGRLVLSTGERTFTTVHNVAGSALAPGRYATLTVVDTGTGITPEVRERLFEPFFTTKERGHGTGLGLATVYGVIQQSGGGVDVQSMPGEGSTFTVYFPLAVERETAAASSEAREATARGEGTILLAEDDDAVRAIARATLERAGYRVLAASDGLSALALLDEHPEEIDLLLTDVIMPNMNGRELAERLSALRPGVPVLFVSGYTDNVLADQGIPQSETALLDKPFTPASLTAAVAAILCADRTVRTNG
jgi:two-component system cell cycle sensor histidine kinase/response regulator CckA